MGVPDVQPDSNNEENDEHREERDCSEIEMAAADLHKIAEYAPKLKDLVSQMPGLEGWVAAKITKASDYISSVYHWLEYNQHEKSEQPETEMFRLGYGDSEDHHK
jgi:hypothetical protein